MAQVSNQTQKYKIEFVVIGAPATDLVPFQQVYHGGKLTVPAAPKQECRFHANGCSFPQKMNVRT
jgi:hypothetical protein